MFRRHEKDWNRLCLSGLLFCLLMVCVGAGCSRVLLGKWPVAERDWTCDYAADEAMKRHDYETGIFLHERFLEANPANALALYHLGYAHGQIGDHRKEVSFYEKAISLGFRESRISYNLGMAYGELNEIENSIGAFKRALEINPDSANNHFALAMAYYQSGISDKPAEEEFLKAIEVDPGHLDARLYLSILYTDTGEMQKAAEQLRKILQTDPANAKAREFLERIERK